MTDTLVLEAGFFCLLESWQDPLLYLYVLSAFSGDACHMVSFHLRVAINVYVLYPDVS